MSWVAVGVGVGTTALSLGGNAIIAANSGGGTNTKSIKDTMGEYIGQLKEVVNQGRANVNAAASEAMDAVAAAGTDYRQRTNRFSRDFWNKLGIENDALIERASALVDEYEGNVFDALNALLDTTTQLNESYASDMGGLIERYGSVENAIDARLVEDNRVTEENYSQSLAQARQDYTTETDAMSDRAREEAVGLGDRFLEAASFADQSRAKDGQAALDEIRGATRDVDATVEASRALGFNMENAAQFGQLADSLSKMAQQTRMDLLATADPRALELSAIADENAAAMMSGRISADVQANLARTGAMKALQGGFAGGQMQRNLEARDLGLTSLDLQQRGTEMYDAQRRLNYDTRVAGTQVNPFDVMVNNGLSSQQALTTATDNANRALDSARLRADVMVGTADALYRNRMGVFESDRNQRLDALTEATRQKLGTRDTTFGTLVNQAGNIFDNSNRLNVFRAETARDANVRSTAMSAGVTQDIYNNMWGLSDTIFNTRVGTAGQRTNVGLAASDKVYATNVAGQGSIFDMRVNREGNIYQGVSNAALTTGAWKAAYENSALNAMAEGLGSSAATNANIPLLQAAENNSRSQAAAQIWGSAINSGASLAGAFAANSRGFSAMPNRNVGSYWSQGNNPMGLTQDQASFVGNANW